MANMHQLASLANMATLMNGRYSDLTITCEGRLFHVHKNVLCSASAVLAAECDSKMREAQSNIIERTHFDAATVERMISYIYKQTYAVNDVRKIDQDHTHNEHAGDGMAPVTSVDLNHILIAHVRMYAVGDYYQLPNLQTFAKDSFVEASRGGFQVAGFINVIREVNRHTLSTDRSVRDELRAIATTHIEQLSRDDGFMAGLAELDDVQDFAADMLRQVVQQQVQNRNEYNKHLQIEDKLNDAYESEIVALKRKVEMLELTENEEFADVRRRHELLAASIDTLVTKLMEMPRECRRRNCDCSFDKLKLEMKGNGDWMVRCAKCRCKLVF